MANLLTQNIYILPALILFFIILVWNGINSWLILKTRKHYHHLTAHTNRQNLETILNQILEIQKNDQKDIQKLFQYAQKLEKQSLFHFQRYGFKRFNPFSETGGEQSFILALLNEYKSGIVISSLHSREVTRVYAKQVLNGKGKEFPLSEEEKQVVDKATHITA